ncbi:uncharacterized protein LOC5516654 isoform X2 [Nematostella vectensis]|uniref:uncharacterized protein LOC5516654 isoform X2 n=1 Tax=Nematostella vectensis TaxID=45351 RepID=UPI0020778D63|nr:uncharacterized protein LOC5516654 isoform X2 [Nematostella vectensis]
MDGVPDATAGPGVDEESHWVISKADISQFFIATYRLVQPIIFEIKISSNTPASPSYTQESQEPQEETRHCKRPFRISSPVIKGTCTKHFHSIHFLPTKLLDTVYSLLYEDIDEVPFIMTKTLVDGLENNDVAKRTWWTDYLDLPITSLAMSFTATPFSCGTLCDELSRLWLLVVLNPKMSHRKKDVLTGWLEELDLEIYRVFKDKHLLPWIGVEIALNVLRNVDLTRDELRCITNEDVPLATVSAVKMVQFNLQKSDVEPNEQRVRQPYTIRIGTVDLEIQTWCAIIQALQFRQCDAAATNLAFEISAALVSFFLGQILGHCDTDKLPFTLCDLASRSDAKSYSLEAMEDEKESKRPEPIWQRDTIVDVSTFAFLFDVLSVDERLTQAAFAHHRKCILKRPDQDEEAVRGIHSGNEIRDLIGLIGLFLPRVPLPLTDTDQFDADNWLAVQLMSRPITVNWMVLCQIAQFVRDHTAHWYLAPPSSLIRVILYHAPSNAETLELVLEPVLCCLSFPCPKAAETEHLVLLNSVNSQLVEELAVLAILRLSDYVDRQKILDAIFTQNGYLRKKLFDIAKSLRIRMLHSSISVQCDTDRLSYVARALKVRKSEITLRSYCPDHDNQADEQKLMRLIFKLSEHSLRMSKSCKGYSRSDDLSWLTERVLEMGEQGFSFFLTCLGGDLSEMITAKEAFRMCEKFLEKFKIFFPLDAPNRKTPDRPEGATALVNGILELFTDVAYKNSNWSEIELCISSMPSSLVPWMAQHLRVIAPDKQVPSSILLSTSKKTFNYFKQNFRSSRVFSMSLQQDVYEDTTPLLVDLAFDLGVLGLKAFSSESRRDDDTTDKMRSYISNFCDHDNQADEQKLMRLIFKLSELSLRLSKSCKGYSRFNDLSWLTERVLEMGEQGFSFFLTCLCGDLSEMITVEEAFQMCKEFLEKFKIFFPLDAPNKKTPDRPEGATALFTSILEPFTDVAYKNSNWSEIELHISSMSFSLVPWMAQHLRVIAPDKQVPSSILLSTSKKTFNYFKQNFRSSSVGSMSLQQNVYEDTIPPLVDLAFDLGILGLKAFSSESRTDDDTTDKMRSYMSNFCDHDNQADEQKLMRLIFKLSELSLRLSKSCKEYSRSNDLSWLTERVLEMGEQGFSFFLTCLCGDLSEMITAREAFQMCEKFLEKFKIFFPLDAPNKKTPDRPEGATALVNGILEPFTDVAYKNSNWSEIEPCILSMSSSLVPWMAQHLRVIAPDKQVPSSILLYTSEKTFNYFKQNFRSSRVFSMSLQQDVYENTIPPLVDLAFDLGVLGLKAFSSESRTDDDTTDKMRSYISNFCDQDNQADEQKVMRLIFKLSELSLRLSKSCKGYSRPNDLSWLTERVLEMGEQGFSFFLTCLCGDLSEMITAEEAFQMCEKFLKKFKIFFPLDAPNKKTPDRPEGATALVNGILELFTDVAYKNSNWSEIELCISSMSSSLVPWMAQHLRVIAPDKQVPSSILLSTSEKTFNYFKQNFQSSSVEEEDGSMSLQQDVYEDTTPLLVDLAFDLGVLGLKAFSSESRTDDDTTDKMRSYISNFCDHDNQADEQKLMRLIFKLSELSLRLSKSCKGYSRSNDLSWLTERVLEMGEQGFSFFLTCLGGDLSEMITAREAFQMCEKFLEKFKIFFPLDAPNKKTPDRPEGATALFNGILEPFTDVAYKNSNWSEIELCISSMSSSLFLWMAQHLRVIAPDKQVPSSILLSTSKKTFNYFKQNFQSSRVFSMSLQQDVYEDTTPLLVDLAFDLGVLGLKAFSSESRTDDDTTDKMRSYISNFCDHDNQADEQKLMRLIFKLSELSLRLSKSCKGYSRFNDLSWLTERVLEMGEQGFSFFLTCLCGDLSEMITAGEAFQMCEKFLEKFKIFFPLDAPNKKTPDRPEGATALFTSVLEPFTDVAYKNSNWSEIELCISSMSYSLVTWMAQYLRVIAPDKQVPSSILLSTSKKTFNYFKQISTAFANSKQNFQSSSVEEEDGSMSLQQDVYEDTTPLLVDLAFDLGVLGLKAFSSESRTDDDTTDKMRSYISNFCDQDNQADEQKLMRLIFKLSELSLRLSKSCKEYSRSNDLSWLTERVLEMGEQGFSFFLTCLCGDLSEMITVEESFQMCKKFLEKFKIFFPLDAPNKKTPDRPEGATALVNGILEPFTDVAYKNSNWSEIELHISSTPSSLVPWMAQHLRVIAPVKQVPSSILLSTSEKTFNKQNLQSSSVEEEDGSMSLQQDVYEDTTPPLVDLAFDLGILGLKAFSSESRTDDDATDKMCSYMSNFCELVNYIGQKRWSKNWERTRENVKERRRLARRRGWRCVKNGAVASTAFWRSNSELESAYLSPFVDALIEAVCDPMLLDQCLREVSTSLYSDHNKRSWEDFKAWFQVSLVVDCYSSLSKLLVKTIEAFKKRVLGPKTKELVNEFINQPNKPPHRNAGEEFSLELRYYRPQMHKYSLVEILMAAKGVINTRDPFGSTYRELVTSLVTQEPALKDFVKF